MTPRVERIVQRIREAESDLAPEVDEQQRRWNYRVYRGRVWFDHEVRIAHRRLRQSIPAFIRQGSLLSLLTAPITYSLFVPLVLLDLWVPTPHSRYHLFVDYGDAAGYRNELPALRRSLCVERCAREARRKAV